MKATEFKKQVVFLNKQSKEIITCKEINSLVKIIGIGDKYYIDEDLNIYSQVDNEVSLIGFSLMKDEKVITIEEINTWSNYAREGFNEFYRYYLSHLSIERIEMDFTRTMFLTHLGKMAEELSDVQDLRV